MNRRIMAIPFDEVVVTTIEPPPVFGEGQDHANDRRALRSRMRRIVSRSPTPNIRGVQPHRRAPIAAMGTRT